MELLVGEALLHVEVPNGDTAIAVANGCEAVHRVAQNTVLRGYASATRHGIGTLSFE